MEIHERALISQTILEELFNAPFDAVYKNIGDIVQENVRAVLNTSDTETIRFVTINSGTFFTKNLPNFQERTRAKWNREGNINIPLLDAYRNELLYAIGTRDKLEEEKDESASYIRHGLNLCDSLLDAREIFPTVVHEILIRSFSNIFQNGKVTISPNLIASFKLAHEEASDTLKERIFLNLLLKGT